jgi:hypothetical protein
MKITSPAFSHQGNIPAKYTCDGENISPPLQISGVPPDALSLVLLVEDPDAPSGNFVHWVVYNIPVTIGNIPENTEPGLIGLNDYHKAAYDGPCPPAGLHRYFFKLSALDGVLDLQFGQTQEELREAMEGHVIEQVELIGRYARRRKTL